ncbi:hypothetical protein BDD43_2852 [Mucilaginibacter gracilis]|uniref:Uncharacterized protein n=1 Tax=Mucilaginibacter gracilis TaxID=423350 RepID=A0A495J149_9SPHI|nr:hypothetical protein [Mucilaginibacter gracilis]RKR82667.1 hypothetical protein BDD43_2852 [Mucilaginibacter gracilis]
MLNYKRNFYFLLVIAFFAAITLGYYAYHQHQVIALKANQIKALQDTCVLYRTKNGASGASKLLFTGTKDDVLAVLKEKDAVAYQTVKATDGIHSYKSFSTLTKIDTIVKADTVYIVKDTTGKLTYRLSKDINVPGLYDAKISVVNDSVSLGLKVYDKYVIVAKERSNGLFKSNSIVVSVENQNKYVTVSNLQSYEIQEKKKNLGLKIGGLVTIGGLIYFLVR